MSDSKNSLFHSISLLALVLSATAIFLQQQSTPPPTSTSNETTTSSSTSELEESLSQLRGEVRQLQAQLESIEATNVKSETTGAQTLVQDLITGLFILIEDSLAIDDFVNLGSHMGTVEALSIRTVKLRDLDGIVHIIPFSQIQGIQNWKKK